LGEYFELPQEEMYGEFFDIPAPDELVLVSWFQGGEVFRSGCCYSRGRGRIFYFRPGHETYPTYYDANVQRVIANAVRWLAPAGGPVVTFGHRPQPLEAVT
ncbi:MAG: ThuA domain-containing protein, partial [Anaerolineae bacterium]|nr:ThuA domain-containing protein [Anaerolineae bacterium]MCB0238797.1 ThuA domain-containing protein [Anaerolineae bacterium]